MKTSWAALIRRRASPVSNQATRSISGNDCSRPDPGGHSSANSLLRAAAGSRSPAAAHAVTTLPPFWRVEPSGMNGGSGRPPCPSPPGTRALPRATGPRPRTARPSGSTSRRGPSSRGTVRRDARAGPRAVPHAPGRAGSRRSSCRSRTAGYPTDRAVSPRSRSGTIPGERQGPARHAEEPRREPRDAHLPTPATGDLAPVTGDLAPGPRDRPPTAGAPSRDRAS